MKNLIIKSASMFFILLFLTLNIVVISGDTVSETEIKLKTHQAEASMEPDIDCWSASKINLQYSYTDCSTCDSKNFRRGIGDTSKCSP